MVVETPGAAGAALIDRAKNILLQPRAEWDRIAPEPANLSKLYLGYVLPLAAIAAICTTIGLMLFAVGGFGFTIRVGPVSAIASGVSQFVTAFVMIYLMGVIINALAPNFGSQQSSGQAQKLSVYSCTAGLIGGVAAILPALSILSLVGFIYSLVLLYLGLPRLMKTPDDKRVGYFAFIVIAMIGIALVASLVLATVRTSFVGFGSVAGFGQSAPTTEENVTIDLPGGGSVSVSELEKMGQAYSGAAPGAAGVAVDPSQLQALLPASLPGGFTRTSVSSSATGAMGMGAAQAEAGYENGESNVTLTIVHMGAMAGMTAMAGAVNIQENREDADGYSRTRTVDGRVYTEEVNRVAGTAQYGVIGRGVAVTAEGQGVDISVVRTAVEAVGIARAEGVGVAQ
jgi:Yip1 domain